MDYTLTIRGTAPAGMQENVLAFSHGTGSTDSAQQLCADWATFIQTAYLACVTGAYSIVLLSARQIGGSGAYDLVTTGAGARSGDSLPPQVSGLITWRSGIPGRSYRGRSYMPQTVEGDNNGGLLSTAYMTALTTYAALYLATSGFGLLWKLGIHSKALSIVTPVTGFTVQPFFDVQRRRGFNRGA